MKQANKHSTKDLFIGRPKSFELFRLVNTYIKTLGDVEVRISKTQVSYGIKKQFAWVWLPQMWIKKQPENSIVLAFGLRRRVKDKRIKESVEPYPGRFTHHVVIEKPVDFDRYVKTWLKEAYESA